MSIEKYRSVFDMVMDDRVRRKFQTFKQFAKGEKIVGMVTFRGCAIIATTRNVYAVGPDGTLSECAFEVHEGRDDQIGKTTDQAYADEARQTVDPDPDACKREI